MMKLSKIFVCLLLSLYLFSCGSTKTIPYLQTDDPMEFKDEQGLYDARIKPKDLLTIVVSTYDKVASQPFNLTMPAVSTNVTTIGTQATLLPYLVDNDGTIEFPVLGKIKVIDKTKTELEKMLKEALRAYLTEEPVINVRLVNYKISVLGEVNRPNSFTVANEKINVLEALALAGDLTIFGKRENIKLIRERADGNSEIALLNLNDPNIINSPHFYLQQNDILYVEPNKVKARNSRISSSTTIWFTVLSTLTSIASLMVTVFK
ncbi:polysaccharide biosynthesis/export family protein [Bacteroidales bacterium OttesenSCG-928-I21]|nr:polysaccharide biosynthesis/export family protein [Bacteroidales bacterium OttesenSCG-928-I21]